jgi:hypothetical protein
MWPALVQKDRGQNRTMNATGGFKVVMEVRCDSEKDRGIPAYLGFAVPTSAHFG